MVAPLSLIWEVNHDRLSLGSSGQGRLRTRLMTAWKRTRLAFALLLALVATPAVATEPAPQDPWSLRLFRFEFDNDSFLGSDDSFSAGWSLQLHSRLMDQWGAGSRGWIGKLPGLGDDGEGRRIVRCAAALTQVILTPSDVSIEAPQPDDVPWAGVLAATSSWSSYDNRRLGAVQFYLGCMGPCSGGEQVQKFIHEDLGFGEPPKGWDNQLVNQWLANLNYEYRYKLAASDEARYVPGRFAADFAAGGMAGVGNAATLVRGDLEFRFGWGLPMGFTKIPDFAPLGLVLDPVYFDPGRPLTDLKRWRGYFNLVARLTWFDRVAPFEGGETVNGGFHPEISPIPGRRQALFGVHVVRVPIGFHVTYYRYLDPQEFSSGRDWVNFTIEYRF